MKYGLLEKIDSPIDLKELDMAQLRQLCDEIRAYIVECCSTNPGHLASSLGAVELTVGVHYVFDTPQDKFVFDVGHQAYAHKIITGRREAFRSLRTEGGISGFPNRDESEYDCFGVGHSSTSISAALGFAEAARLQGLHRKVIALIGDGAMTGGLAFEGLNNAGAGRADMLILLNDNNQSIESNTGAMHEYLLNITTSNSYNRLKDRIWHLLGDGRFRDFIQRWVRSLKSWFVKSTGGDVFESLGIRYFGPIDGNDIAEVVKALRKLKDMDGPRILHCMTVKGKGYGPAEKDPVTWHAPGRFVPETGQRIGTEYDRDRYQDVFGQVLLQLAETDPKVVGITPAMAQGCGMNLLAERRPAQFFDVGIEEEHAVTFSAGLAAGGMKPFCNIYSAFSQRAYDQIIHDVALQRLPVVLCFDRAGLVGEDGATHQGAFDIAAYRSIPGTIVSSPKDETELKQLMYTAYRHDSGPFIIRYPRGMGRGTAWQDVPFAELPVGKAEPLLEGDTVAVVSCGPAAYDALRAAEEYAGKVGVYNFRFIKPLDCEALDGIAARYERIVTVEDGTLLGGLYGAVCEYVLARGYDIKVEGIGIPDRFISQARQTKQLADCGIDYEGIKKSLSKYL
ncbi:MAG TPA: 1-deoxy-D-xylulose-5-phosphate synthase [Candidatus Cryptobacteroides pullicola]|nr:1-deoxy-D-xylulose-5-phosphate synthase [Candidatus Cryptobacteroides pullicola]